MRCFRITLALMVLLLVPLNLFALEQGFARLSLIEGDVQVRIAESDDWVPAAPNTPIYEGDSIWSPKGSRAEIQLRDGSVIRLDAKTALNVLKVENDFLQFNLGMGRAYIRTGANREWSMQFDLSESTVRVDDKGRYRLDIQEDGDEDISVFRGSAYVESYGSRTRVRTGEMLSLEDSRSEISPVNPQDAWDRWNSDRDARQARRSAGGERRLPAELVAYEDELSASGEWVVTREYGQVWRPTAAVPSDWAPYREGRWIWRGGEYVWVSYEPWGWAPYHYGRWAVVPGFGWCWVPPLQGDVFWGPGFVGWITTSSSVGWVPLAPGDIYYGRGHYGRNSVNVTNVTNITINNRTNIYRNAVQRNAVTSVDRNSFISGRGRYVRNSGDIFKKERDRAVAGRPEPRLDSRAIRMPRVKEVPADKLPPKVIANVPVRELKERFPRVNHGADVKSPRDDRRQQPGVPSRPGAQGRDRAPGLNGQGAGRGAEGKQPLVKPSTVNAPPATRTPAPQAGGEQKQRGAGRREQETITGPADVRPGGGKSEPVQQQGRPQDVSGGGQHGKGADRQETQRGAGRREQEITTSPADVRPGGGKGTVEPAQQQGRPQDVPVGVQRGKGVDRQETSRPGQDRKEAQGRKDAGRKEGAAPPERKARGVWKIKPKEEAPKEKVKDKEKEKENNKR